MTFEALGGFAPELAVHVKGPDPLAESPTLWPVQIDETAGVTEKLAGELTSTVITELLTQAPTALVTV